MKRVPFQPRRGLGSRRSGRKGEFGWSLQAAGLGAVGEDRQPGCRRSRRRMLHHGGRDEKRTSTGAQAVARAGAAAGPVRRAILVVGVIAVRSVLVHRRVVPGIRGECEAIVPGARGRMGVARRVLTDGKRAGEHQGQRHHRCHHARRPCLVLAAHAGFAVTLTAPLMKAHCANIKTNVVTRAAGIGCCGARAVARERAPVSTGRSKATGADR